MIQDLTSPSARRSLYLTLTAASVILFFWSVRLVYPVFVEADAPFGLVSYLPACYWVGLGLVTTASVFAFVDPQQNRDGIFICIALALGLFILGVTVFTYESPGDPTGYYPTSEVRRLLTVGHLDLQNPEHVATYYGWPAIHFISAALAETTGCDMLVLVKYAPLFWIICLATVSYATGKRLGIQSNYCFLISFMAVSSWMLSFAGYYYARLPATMLFLLLFMLFVTPRKANAEAIVVIVLFGALVISHGMTGIAVLPGLCLLAVYRRDFKFVTLLIAVFAAWYMWQSSLYVERGLSALALPFGDIFRLAQAGRYEVASSFSRIVARYSSLCYLGLYGALIASSLFLLCKRRIIDTRRGTVIALICWSVGVSSVTVFGDRETLYRVFVYSVVPAACIVALTFSSRKLLLPIMCALVPLSLFLNYSGHAGWGQVTSSYLGGSEFLAVEVKPEDSFFFTYSFQTILYYDPDLLQTRQGCPLWSRASPYDPEAVHSGMDEYHYVLVASLGTEAALFAYQTDPWGDWPETAAGTMANLLYDNGGFRVYENALAR